MIGTIVGLALALCGPVAKQYVDANDAARRSAVWLSNFYPHFSELIDNTTYSSGNPDCGPPVRHGADDVRCSKKGVHIEAKLPILRGALAVLRPMPICGRNNAAIQVLGDIQHDGHKFACGMPALLAGPPFTVLSLGSNGDFQFEMAVFKIFGRHARIHTFDCTVGSAVPPMLSGVVTYHQICVGVPDRTDRKGRQFLSWGSLMDRLQAAGQLVGKVEMMKIDVEGHERNFLWDMMTRGDARYELPKQIMMELHGTTIHTNGQFYQSIGKRMASAAEIALQMMLWHSVGYRLIYREDNPGSPRGTEITLLRIQGCHHSE